MLKLGTKCWISAFNAHGSRGIIVAVQVGAVKIYVAVLIAIHHRTQQWRRSWKEEKAGWNSGNHQNGFLSFIPRWMLMYFFAGFFLISPCVWPNSGYWCCLFLTLRISLISIENLKFRKLIFIFFHGFWLFNGQVKWES